MKHHRTPAGRILAFLPLLAALVCPLTTATAQNLGAASGYSYFIFGDASQSNSNSSGAAAIGGNATLSNYSLGSQLPSSSNYSLVVDGNLTFSGGTVSKGSLLVGGTANLSGVNIAKGSLAYGEAIDFNAAKNSYGNLSDSLASSLANGAYTLNYGNLVFTGTDAGLNSFTIQAADFNSANNITINAPTGSTVVINVGGSLVNFTNRGVNVNGISGSNVLYNFYDATSLNLAGITVLGSILAPDAHVSFSNGNMNGTLIANSLGGSGTFNYNAFQGNLPAAVPEPSAFALIGAAGAFMLLRRRR